MDPFLRPLGSMQPSWQSPIPPHFTTQPLPFPQGQGPQSGWGNPPLLMSPQPQSDWMYPAAPYPASPSPYPAYPMATPQPEWNYLTVDYALPPDGGNPSAPASNSFVQVYQISQNQFMNPFGTPGGPPPGQPGTPPSGMPPQGLPPQGMPPQGAPPQGGMPPGMPPQGMPPAAPPQDESWAIEIIQNVFNLIMQCIQQLMLEGDEQANKADKCEDKKDKKHKDDHKMDSDHKSHKKESHKSHKM